MTQPTNRPDTDVLDVRGLRKPDKHPTIFAAYAALRAGEAFILVNDHDPQHLHDEFEAGHAGSYDWEYLNREMRDWRIRITKLADTATAAAEPEHTDAVPEAWRLQISELDVD